MLSLGERKNEELIGAECWLEYSEKQGQLGWGSFLGRHFIFRLETSDSEANLNLSHTLAIYSLCDHGQFLHL